MISWIIHSVILIVIAILAKRFIQSILPEWIFWLGLALKLIAGIVLGLVFYNYYGAGDTINFFNDAISPNSIAWNNEPRTEFFIRILRPIAIFTGDNYWITSLYFSLISFIGYWYSVNVLVKNFPSIKWIIASSFILVPSVVFWSSGIIKDSLAGAALTLAVSLIINTYLQKRINIVELSLMVVCGVLLLNIKHYLLIAVLLFVAVLFGLASFKRLGLKSKLGSIVVFALAISLTQFIHPYLKFDLIPWTLQQNNQAILAKSDAESRINIELKEQSWSEVLRNIPKALHAGLFRPSIFDKTPIWGWIHRIENLLLTILIMMTIILAIKQKISIDWPILLAASCAIVLLAIMLPLSTPNFGTLVRYKNAYMPFLFLLSSILPYRYLTSQTEE